jgi:hypothetical protein
MPDAAVEPARDAPRALHHRAHVEADPLRGEAVIARMLHVVVDLRRAQQRLRRDAAPVEADAPEMLPVHDRGLEPELGRPDRGHVAAGTRADDEDVVS